MTEEYTAPEPTVTSIDGLWVEVFTGDNRVSVGDLIRIDTASEATYGVIRTTLGERKARVLVLGKTRKITGGTAITFPESSVSITAPGEAPRQFSIDQLALAPSSDTNESISYELATPEFGGVLTQFDLVETGYEYVDLLSPLARGGINLILDNSPSGTGFKNLCARAADDIEPDRQLITGPETEETAEDWYHIEYSNRLRRASEPTLVALRIAACWLQYWRDKRDEDSLFVGHLPSLQLNGTDGSTESEISRRSIDEVIDKLTTHLYSTESAKITTLLRLPLQASHEGIASIAETLQLGDVETSVFVSDEDTYDPLRSASSVELDSFMQKKQTEARRKLKKANQIKDRNQIFGEAMLSEKERELLNRTQQFFQKLD